MRRSITRALVTAGVAMALTTSSAFATKPHFVPSSFTGVVDSVGTAYLSYQVAGLGNGGSGRITAKGWYKINCYDTNNGNTLVEGKWTKRIVEHDVYADENGNYIPNPPETLNAGACKGTGRYTFASTDWACVSLTLRPMGSNQPWDTYTYQELITGNSTYSSRCP